LATAARAVAVLDPMTGRTGVATTRRHKNGDVDVQLRLEPGHSTILRTFDEQPVQNPPWSWLRPGQVVEPVASPWEVEFVAGGPAIPEPLAMETLDYWTSSAAPSTQAFAGTARYRCRFDVPSIDGASDQNLVLDLGDVKHVARIHLNDVSLGTVFMRPYWASIPPGLLRSKDNTLEIQVTNLAANRIRDLDRRKVGWRNFHDINFVNINYRAFDASDWPVFESGLLGPVTVRRQNDPR
jgi:hypothetical protein